MGYSLYNIKIKKERYLFREEYLGKLIEKWKVNLGKYIVDLENLPSHFIIKSNEKGENILNGLLNFVKEKYGLDMVNRRFSAYLVFCSFII